MPSPKKPTKKPVASRATSKTSSSRVAPRKTASRSTPPKSSSIVASKKGSFFSKRRGIVLVVVLVVFGILGTYLLQQGQAATYSNYGCTTYPTLRKGSSGNCVKKLQNTLQKKWGYKLNKGVDGDFGSSTDSAVRDFQTKHKKAVGGKVDGVVGKDTWPELRRGVTYISTAKPVGSSTSSPGGSSTSSSSSRSAKINKMISLAKQHSYTSPLKGRTAPKLSYGWYIKRNGNQADCGVFVGAMIKRSGMDTSWPVSGTVAMRGHAQRSSKWQTLPLTSANLQKGDIILVQGHVLIWAGSGAGLTGNNVAFEAALSHSGQGRSASQIPFKDNSQGNVKYSFGRKGGFIARLR